MVEAYLSAWSRSFDYTGRTRRSDYWWYVLANFIVAIILSLLANRIEIITSLYFLYSVAQILPSLALSVRRLRDIGKNWLWIFLPIIPIVGFIWYIFLMCQPSQAKAS